MLAIDKEYRFIHGAVNIVPIDCLLRFACISTEYRGRHIMWNSGRAKVLIQFRDRDLDYRRAIVITSGNDVSTVVILENHPVHDGEDFWKLRIHTIVNGYSIDASYSYIIV